MRVRVKLRSGAPERYQKLNGTVIDVILPPHPDLGVSYRIPDEPGIYNFFSNELSPAELGTVEYSPEVLCLFE